MSEVLKSSIEEALRRIAAKKGVEITISPEKYRDDALHINLYLGRQDPTCFVSVSRHPLIDEGSSSTTHTFVAADAALHPHEERKLDAFIAEAVRVRRREAAIRRYIRSTMAPAWSYVMHRVAHLLVSHSAQGRDLTFVPVIDNLVRVHRKRGARARPLTTGRALEIPLADFSAGYGQRIVEARADRIFAHDLELGVRPDNSPYAIFKDLAAPELVITGMRLPETMLLACPGMDLAKVVDHPAFGDHAGVPIRSAVNDEDTGSVRLRLPVILEPAGDTPEGVDVSWRQG